MRADELDPYDAGALLHFHDQSVLAAADVEHDSVVATDAAARSKDNDELLEVSIVLPEVGIGR